MSIPGAYWHDHPDPGRAIIERRRQAGIAAAARELVKAFGPRAAEVAARWARDTGDARWGLVAIHIMQEHPDGR